MRRKRIVTVTATILTVAGLCAGWMLSAGRSTPSAAAVLASEQATSTADQPPLIVHEWGTFTSFSGSNGIKLEFRPLEERDLPRFVFSPANLSLQWLSKASLPAIQRMETPVTYFYTPVERDVTVRVSFPQGLLTEFYPPVRSLGPKADTVLEPNPPALKDSWLDWGQVHLIPTESLRAGVQDAELSRRFGRHLERTMTPDASGFPHYAAARETDSAIVQVRHRPRQDAPFLGPMPGDYFEKFLFYRGVGNFELPLKLTAQDNAAFSLTNSGKEEIRSLFLVTVRGEEVDFRQYPSIAGNAQLDLKTADRPATLKELGDAVCQALMAEGLYEKESRAMIAAWESSWFGEEGTRLFYILPQRLTDELLPLQITPSPTEQVRVLVGRLEFMTPSMEREILDLVQQSAAARTELQQGSPSPLLPELTKLGRLGEPALVRAASLSETEPLKREALLLINELRARRDQESGG